VSVQWRDADANRRMMPFIRSKSYAAILAGRGSGIRCGRSSRKPMTMKPPPSLASAIAAFARSALCSSLSLRSSQHLYSTSGASAGAARSGSSSSIVGMARAVGRGLPSHLCFSSPATGLRFAPLVRFAPRCVADSLDQRRHLGVQLLRSFDGCTLRRSNRANLFRVRSSNGIIPLWPTFDES
jgi:hypothetical protein